MTPETKAKISMAIRAKLSDPSYRAKLSTANKAKWDDPEFRRKGLNHLKSMSKKSISEDAKKKISDKSKKLWDDDKYRAKIVESTKQRWQDPSYQTKMSEMSKSLRQDPEYVANISRVVSESNKKRWKNREFRNKMVESSRQVGNEGIPEFVERTNKLWGTEEFRNKMADVRSNQPKVSSIQERFYKILNELGVKFYREYNDKPDDPECKIGSYNFDCVIPRDDLPTLLVDVNGDYWHSQQEIIDRDERKAEFVADHTDQYELKYVWEHELKNEDRVKQAVQYWLGITPDAVDFRFKDLVINDCDYDLGRDFISKYHYLPNLSRGGTLYGAYLKQQLIAVCVFSSLIRQNINTGSFTQDQCLELSRLCIHPSYHKKNFASWFISRCLTKLDPKIKLIISYCDTTFNHDGGVYKASNFKLDGVIRPDYWYVDKNGIYLGKKALYNKAVKAKMTESNYAEINGYKKVYGKEKLRFIYER